MAEYINREALIAEYDRVHIGEAGGARKLMVEAPACDVVEVVHGRWEWHKNHWECSACRGSRFHDIVLGLDAEYCGYCGAKMDGERRCEE